MKNLNKKVDAIRMEWLKIFTKNNYFLINPSPLIPNNDSSLLWINSGVAALKKYFSNPQLTPAKNLVNCQRVIRTNDIDKIDSSSYHQTLFEMLGCFSIGGNFKSEVIPLIWKFFTSNDYLAIDPQRLFVTILANDQETLQIWKKQPGFFEKNIVIGSRETNFWDMGNGPCGPNSEIYYSFRTEHKTFPVSIQELDSKDFIEIINIVFSEFYHQEESYLPLSQKCVDVGGGLERIALILQNVKNTFQTDIWINSVNFLKELCIKKETFFTNQEWRIYVIVDHLRTFIFAIADGALTSHKQHGYILKKLIKRSCLFAYILKITKDELLMASERIITSNSNFYSFLFLKKNYITENLDKEITKFLQSFEISINDLKKYLETFRGEEISAEKVFFWYDTKGIPIELIKISLLKKGINFNQQIFDDFLNEQRKRSSFYHPKVNVFDC